jgi:hypothetical protein
MKLGLAFVLALVSASLPLPALGQHRGGGGYRGGHGSHGYGRGYAVPRSGGSYYRGGPAARHPRAGTGYGHSYGYRHGYGYGHYGGHYGGYYGYSGRYYGGYYPSYYSPYYYAYPYFSLGFGWPYYSWPYSASVGVGYNPSVSVSYASGPTYVSDERPAPVREPERGARRGDDDRERDAAWLRVEVRPEDTSVYVDDQFRGTGRDSRSLGLSPGLHTIELVRPGYVTERRELRVETGGRYEVSVELQRPR